MSKLEELIEELCPNGVEYKTIGELSTLVTKQTGFDYTKCIKDSLVIEKKENTIPYIQTKFFRGKKFDYNTDYYVPFEIVDRYPKITLNEKCILFSIVGASIGNVGLFSGENECFLGGAICVAKFKKNVNIDYIYYCAESDIVQKQIKNKTKGAGQATVTVDDIRNFSIPIPPIPVQEEIVRILDNFTELIAELQSELQSELQARAKQYEYYRNELYKRLKTYPTKRLDEVTKISRGIRVVKKELSDNQGYPVFQNCLTPMGYYDKKNCDADSTYIISAGAAGEIGFSEEDFWAADDCLVFSELDGLLNKYIYYFLLTKYDYLKKNVRKASIPRISRTMIEKLEIPIIPLKEQQQIIEVLDRFNNLCSDISEGLSAEIEARKKQYEYYRDRLLSFKELLANE